MSKVESMQMELRVVLQVAGVRLEPLEPSHAEGLRAAADDRGIWTHMPMDGSAAGFDDWFGASLELALAGREGVWSVRTLGDGALVGSTRYLSIVPEHRRLEIGHTWYRRSAWGGAVNPACKLALLRYGFETLGLNRVELKTDILNLRSQAAIERLGAVREGVFRAHMVRRDGTARDSVYYAITREDWPRVRDALSARLTKTAAAIEAV
jgi:RimJ/RimL family protein N-acetyltransferase